MFVVVPKNGQTWLICGGRDFIDREMFYDAMSDLIRLRGCPNKVVHGAAKGAELLEALKAIRKIANDAIEKIEAAEKQSNVTRLNTRHETLEEQL